MGKTRRRQVVHKESTVLSTLLYHFLILAVGYGALVPVLSVVLYGLKSEGSKTTEYYIERALAYLFNSMRLSIPVTVFSTGIAILISFALWRFEFKGRGFARVLLWHHF